MNGVLRLLALLPPCPRAQHVTNELHYIARQQTPLSARTRPLCLNRTVFADVMLIVMYNTPNLASMPLLRSLYGDAFPRMQ